MLSNDPDRVGIASQALSPTKYSISQVVNTSRATLQHFSYISPSAYLHIALPQQHRPPARLACRTQTTGGESVSRDELHRLLFKSQQQQSSKEKVLDQVYTRAKEQDAEFD
ncbi:hypothetical protein Fot_04667 [Forsythia ovata]|uniref:Uncharacterized protein n=1 Tax=Forsythia ovata TaxID=205694 RepID=A0ABD1XGA7_9LAMI